MSNRCSRLIGDVCRLIGEREVADTAPAPANDFIMAARIDRLAGG